MTVALRPRPDRADPRSWSFPSFERSTLANGVTLLACQVPDRPVAEVRVVIGAGPRHEPLDRPGLVVVAGAALTEGTEDRDADEWAFATESIGARFALTSDWSTITGIVSAPVTRLREALPLAFEALTRPAFRGEDVERVVRNRIGAVFTGRQMPASRAQYAFAAAAFDPAARMALPAEGTVEGLKRITPEDVRRFWTEVVLPSACTVVAVGDFRGLDLPAIVEGAFGRWPAAGTGTVDAAVWPDDSPAAGPGLHVVDFPGSVQSVLAVGLASGRVAVEDRAALRVASHYLGGFFDSRLMTILREERNIAYTAGFGVQHFATAAVLRAQASVQTDATLDAVTTTVDELRAVTGNEIESDRLARSVDNLARTGPVQYTGAGAVAGALARLVSEGLPDDYYDRVRREMAATTAAQAAAAFGRYVDTSRLRVVAVGDAARIVDGLAGLGWGGDVTVEPRL